MENLTNYFKNLEVKFNDTYTKDYTKDLQPLLNNVKNDNDKKKIITWFKTMNKDFELKSYIFSNLVTSLTEIKPETSSGIDYYYIWNKIGIYHLKDLSIKDSIFDKYHNITLDLPLPDVNSDNKCSLGCFIYNRMYKDDTYPTEKLINLIKYLPKKNNHLLNEIVDYHDYVSPNFKSFIQNRIFNEKEQTSYHQIFTLLYARSEVKKLEFIQQNQSNMLILTNEHLTKIIFYGRYLVLDFLNKHYSNLLNQILSNYNPYDLNNINQNDSKLYWRMYLDDIWNGHSWGNDECERECVGIKQQDFEKTFKLLNEISKNYEHVQFTQDIKKRWLENVMFLSQPAEDGNYFISESVLLKDLDLNFDTKESVKKMIECIGLNKTWELMKTHKSHVLEILIS